jgi:hypothetical protein
MFREHDLRIREHRLARRGEEMVCSWDVVGRPRQHDQVTEMLFSDPQVTEFAF